MSRLYLAVPELNTAPIGINWDALAAEFAVSAASLQQFYCQSVSSMMDNYCGQQVYASRPYILRASQDSETAVTDTQEQTFVNNYGNLVFLARYRPIISVVSANFTPVAGSGMTGGMPSPLDLSSAYWEGNEIVFLGPFENYRYQPLRVEVTYIDGFANGLLTSTASADASSLALDDVTGILPGTELTIYDMPPEDVTVAADYIPARGPGTVALAAPTVNAHLSGVRVSALESDAQMAALYLVQHLVQMKVIAGAQAAWSQLGERVVPMGPTDYLGQAKELLNNYAINPGI